jgi:CBS-domain-containing membrane protein
MLVKDVMKKDLVTVRRSTMLRELIHRLQDFHTFPLVPVVEEDNRLIGTVSFHNLIDVFQPYESSLIKAIPFLEREEIDIFELEITPEMATLIVVDDIMESLFMTIDEEDTLEKAYNLMKIHSLDRLPVVDRKKKLVGMIGVFDILVALFREKGIIED